MCFGPVDDPAIQAIFAKLGREWTRAERERVLSWLNQASRLRRVLLSIAYHLGQGTIPQDAEDTWQKFYCHWSDRWKRPITRLDRVIDLFDPVEGSFQGYFCAALRYFSVDEGDRIRRQRGLDRPFPDREDEEGNPIEYEPPDSGKPGPRNPVDAAILTERKKEILDCLQRLEQEAPKYAQVLGMFYFEDMTDQEIAKDLNTTVGSIRTRLSRARQKLRPCLEEKDLST